MTSHVRYIDLLPAEEAAFSWLDDHLDLTEARQAAALDALAEIVQNHTPPPGPTVGAWTDLLDVLLLEGDPDEDTCRHVAVLTRLIAAYLRTTTGMTWQQARAAAQ